MLLDGLEGSEDVSEIGRFGHKEVAHGVVVVGEFFYACAFGRDFEVAGVGGFVVHLGLSVEKGFMLSDAFK